MSREPIREGFDVFVHDGEKAVGAVRQVLRDGEEIIVYVEGGGDFFVPASAIRSVESEKVTLDCSKLDKTLRHAIGHAHDSEDPNIP
ncbi:MAG TPA: hypothetical protein VGF97_07330 [Rhizomicrobium sp.]|jgi:hypothetical protein